MDWERIADLLRRSEFHPTRLLILMTLLLKGKMTFSELQRTLKLTPGNLGSHLSRLEEEGFVKQRRDVLRLRYVKIIELTEKGYIALIDYLSSLEEVLKRAKRGDFERGFSRRKSNPAEDL